MCFCSHQRNHEVVIVRLLSQPKETKLKDNGKLVDYNMRVCTYSMWSLPNPTVRSCPESWTLLESAFCVICTVCRSGLRIGYSDMKSLCKTAAHHLAIISQSTDLIKADVVLVAKWQLKVGSPSNKQHAKHQTTKASGNHMSNGVLKVILGQMIPLAILYCRCLASLLLLVTWDHCKSPLTLLFSIYLRATLLFLWQANTNQPGQEMILLLD